MPPAAKSDFLNKFKDRISVVGRDGTVTKVPNGDAPSVTDSNASCALSVDDSTEEMGAITRMHPALANALLGDVSSSMEVPMGFGMLAAAAQLAEATRGVGPDLGSFGPPPGQQTVVQPPPSQITIVPPQSGHAGQLQGVAEQHAQQAAADDQGQAEHLGAAGPRRTGECAISTAAAAPRSPAQSAA